MTRHRTLMISAFALVFLGSCATFSGGPGNSQYPERAEGTEEDLSPIQGKLVEGAVTFLGAEKLKVGNRTYPLDCTGVVSAIYAFAGIDITSPLTASTGNGVTWLYRLMEDEELLYHTDDPAPGDIIFWDNTWDANDDGRFNDPLTHVGMVVHRMEDGTVEYIHHNYARGIVLESMNLLNPDLRTLTVRGKDVLINSPVRARNSPPAPGGVSLASQLLRHLGRGYLYEK